MAIFKVITFSNFRMRDGTLKSLAVAQTQVLAGPGIPSSLVAEVATWGKRPGAVASAIMSAQVPGAPALRPTEAGASPSGT